MITRPLVPVRAVLVAAAVTVSVGAGCGGDDAEAGRAELVDSLGFLAAEPYGLTEAQVACVAEEVESSVGAGELAALAEGVRAVDAGQRGLADLPDGQGEAVTGAVAACAGRSTEVEEP